MPGNSTISKETITEETGPTSIAWEYNVTEPRDLKAESGDGDGGDWMAEVTGSTAAVLMAIVACGLVGVIVVVGFYLVRPLCLFGLHIGRHRQGYEHAPDTDPLLGSAADPELALPDEGSS